MPPSNIRPPSSSQQVCVQKHYDNNGKSKQVTFDQLSKKSFIKCRSSDSPNLVHTSTSNSLTQNLPQKNVLNAKNVNRPTGKTMKTKGNVVSSKSSCTSSKSPNENTNDLDEEVKAVTNINSQNAMIDGSLGMGMGMGMGMYGGGMMSPYGMMGVGGMMGMGGTMGGPLSQVTNFYSDFNSCFIFFV